MAKQLNVDLSVRANTTQASVAIKKLANELNNLGSAQSLKDLPITRELQEAQIAAKQLGAALENSFNISTGTLDLGSFNTALQKSNMSLSQYADKLTFLGKEGDWAFLKVAQSIVKTQTPLTKSNAMLQEFATTLKNTARWQISSSILHGFMGAIQSAYGYAQDLNESLNNIRIVTGYNTEQMTNFAAEANKAAKALSTTTTNYTNASLIFYQQGLSDAEVKERTDVTIKMANAAGASAEKVSDQLTAVWNNFYDGTKSLEYYADVMTALGAATASSTDEIAGGLEKFAAIGDTIGLSYEYAASALATITSNTRQSEEVVGTALKTIFARIQGLNLGETLDDGTTLNKYSEALDKVGISIFDASGEVKKMDSILDEMASKWDTLAQSQQIALAQTVAGTRQYTQLVALMDNWNSGDADSMTANLNTAYGASGALDVQAEIYAESWEASSDRVQAALESIYSQLIDEDFFISINNGLTEGLESISHFINAIGGLKGVLSGVGLLITTLFKDQIGAGINQALSNFKVFSGVASQEMVKMQDSAYKLAMAMTKDLADSEGIDALRSNLSNTYILQTDLRKNFKGMTADQKEVAQAAIEVAEQYSQIALEAGRAAQQARELKNTQLTALGNQYGGGAQKIIQNAADSSSGVAGTDLVNQAEQALAAAKELSIISDSIYGSYAQVQNSLKEYQNVLATPGADTSVAGEALGTALNALSDSTIEATQGFEKYKSKVSEAAETVVKVQSDFDALKQSLDSSGTSKNDLKQKLVELKEKANQARIPTTALTQAITKYEAAMKSASDDSEKQAQALQDLENDFKQMQLPIETINAAIREYASINSGSEASTKGMDKALDEAADSARRAAVEQLGYENATLTAAEETAKAKTIINGTGLAYKSLGSAITGTMQGISSLAMGLNSLSSIKDTLNNTDLSNFEKTTSIMMSLGMAISMVTTGLKSVGNMLQFVTAKTTDGLSAQIGYLLGMTNEDMKAKELCLTKEREVLVRSQVTKEAWAEAVSKEGSKVATEVETAAIWKNVAAKIAQNWYILVIVAALAALAAAIYVAVKAYNADAEAAKKAAKTAEELADASKEAADTLNNLKSSFSAYDSAVDALNDCVDGTEEWNEALQKVNDTVLDLLDAYPELLKQKDLFTRDDSGMLVINEQAKKDVLDEAENRANSAQAASLMGSAMASEAANKSQATSIGRQIGNNVGMGQAYYTDSGVYYDGYINAGKILTENATKLANLTEEEYRQEVAKLLDAAASNQVKSYAGYDAQINSLVDRCVNYQDSINSLAENTEAAANQIANAALLITEEALGDEFSDEAKVMASREYDDLYKNIYDDIIKKDANNNAQIDSQTTTSQSIWERFNKANGTNLVAADNQIQGNDDNRVYAYKDAQTGEEKTYSIEYIAQTIAAHEALKQLSGSAQKATNTLSNMEEKVGIEVGAGLKSLLTEQNFSSMNRQELNTMFSQIDADNGGTVNKDEVLNYLRDSFGMTDEELAQVFNVDTVDEVYTLWSDAWNNANNAITTAGDDLTKTTKAMYDQLASNGDMSELNASERGVLADYLNTAFTNSGKEGAEAFKIAFAKAYGEEQSGFIEAIQQTDWNTVGIAQLRKTLHDCGVAVNYTDAQLQNMIDAMQKASEVTLETATSNYATLHDIIEDLSNEGTISAEDYDMLADKYSEYFMLMADGTYKLMADAEEFYNIVHQDTVDQFKAVQNQASVDNERLANVFNSLDNGFNLDFSGDMDNLTNYVGSNAVNDPERAAEKRTAQLDIIQTMGLADATQLQEWKIGLEEDSLSTDDMVAMSDLIKDWVDEVGGAEKAEAALTEQINANNAAIIAADMAIAFSYDNIEDLTQAMENGTISVQGYNAAWQVLDETEKMGDLNSEEVEEYADYLQEAALSSALLSNELSENTEEAKKAAKEVSIAVQRMNKGISKLAEGWEEWVDILKKSDKSSEEYFDALNNTKDAMSDLLGVSKDYISSNFIADNFDLITEAADGSAEAIDKLAKLCANQIVLDIAVNNGLDVASIQSDFDMMIEAMNIPNIQVGATLDDGDFLAKAQDLITNAGMTVDEANAMFDALGFEANFEQEEKTLTSSKPITKTVTEDSSEVVTYPDGTTVTLPATRTWSYNDGYIPVEETLLVPAMATNGKSPIINSVTRKSSGAMNNGSSKNPGGNSGGGGGSKPKKAATAKKSDVVDRYKQIDDQLDDITDAADDASKAMDRLYGADKLKKMQEVNKLLEKEINLTKKKREEAEAYLEEDKKALQDAAAEAGVTFSFDENGNISNYESQMTALYNMLDSAIATANADGNATEEEQEAIDKIQEKIDAVKDAIAQYDETRELITDLDKEAQDKFNEWQDNNFEMLNYKLEVELEINDDEMRKLEYYLEKAGDDFYQMAESAALMVGEGGQWDVYADNIANYEAYLAQLKKDYEEGKISQDAYVQGLREAQQGIYDNLSELNALDDAMLNYYSDTLAAASEEIAKYTGLMEHQAGVLDHYSTILSLLGKENDYEAMSVILEGQAKMAENQVKVSKSSYEMFAAQAAERKAALDAAIANGASEAEIDLLEKEWWAAQEAANEAQEQMLSDVEAWAESINAILDNKLKSLAQGLENSLTGGFGSFDTMTTAMERANSLQEEYLTTTNKVYETNKLMRTAQQEIDKTTNSLAKKRLKQFVDETQELQNQSKLSQYELDIQQAKYDLLLAEIALKEAQQAKSTVRLQRDSEGNFGYVYTADESAVADAEQKLADAQNSLYNIGLEGANNYAQKSAETLQEMNDTLIDINEQYRNGEFENEAEYQEALATAREYYYERLKQFSELYQVAITTDGRVVQDAWSTEFASMTSDTEQWMYSIDNYLDGVKGAFTEWESQMKIIEEETVGKNLDTLKDKTKYLVDTNKELAESLTNAENGVIKAVNDEIEAVKAITTAYALAREARLKYIGAGEDVANKTLGDLKEHLGDIDWEKDNTSPSNPPDSENVDNNPESNPNADPGSETGDSGSTAGNKPTWERIESAYKRIISGAWGNGVNNRVQKGIGEGYTEDEVLAAQEYINYTFPKNQNGYGYTKAYAKELMGYDTGGYTGSWGSYGKLAILHEKELVLNAHETENFLAGMELLNRIVQAIDLQTASAQIGGVLSTPGMTGMDSNILEQYVTIEAHFEGATDRNEIEAAFDNLINRASQHSNRK